MSSKTFWRFVKFIKMSCGNKSFWPSFAIDTPKTSLQVILNKSQKTQTKTKTKIKQKQKQNNKLKLKLKQKQKPKQKQEQNQNQ